MQTTEDEQEQLDAPPVPWMHGAAGICGGAVSMSIFYPLDLIRTRMHTYTGKDLQAAAAGGGGETLRFRGAIESIKADGVKSMFRGLKIAVLAHSFGWGMYLTIFRTLQQHIARTNNKGRDSSLGDFVAACGAAGVTSAVVTPLNFLKTNIQLSQSKDKVTVRQIFNKTVKEQGAWALMRGVGPQFLLSSHTTIQVAMYECIKRYWWGNNYNNNNISSSNNNSNDNENSSSSSSSSSPPLHGVALASAVSKGFASAVCNPLEVCRTRLQDTRNAGSLDYASFGAAFRTIIRTEGVGGLYRGVAVNVCRVVPTTVVAFVIYETILEVMHRSSKRK